MYSAKISSKKSIDRDIELFRTRCLSSYKYWEYGVKSNNRPRRLLPKEIDALERIPFWVWNAREANYRHTLSMLDAYLKNKSVEDIVITTVHNGFPLGKNFQR